MVATTLVYRKTPSGRAEIGTRRHKLASSLRSLLLLVDGQRDVGQLRHVATTLHAPPDAIDKLVELGLITSAASEQAGPESTEIAAGAPPGPSDAALRYMTLSGLMSEGVREYLGLRGFMTQLKIERGSNEGELLALLPEVTSAIAKARNVEFAREWERLVRSSLD